MYQEVGQAILGVLGERSQVWLADELGIDGAYLNRVLKGKQKPSEGLLREIAETLGQPGKAATWIGLLNAAVRARKAKRLARRQRAPLQVVDGEPIEVTDAERAQFIGAMRALGFSTAKARAVLTSGTECSRSSRRRPRAA